MTDYFHRLFQVKLVNTPTASGMNACTQRFLLERDEEKRDKSVLNVCVLNVCALCVCALCVLCVMCV